MSQQTARVFPANRGEDVSGEILVSDEDLGRGQAAEPGGM